MSIELIDERCQEIRQGIIVYIMMFYIVSCAAKDEIKNMQS